MQRAFPIRVAVVACGDDFTFGDVDGVEFAVNFTGPELKEFLEVGEFGGEVVVLPDEFLQDFFKIGHVIVNLRGC